MADSSTPRGLLDAVRRDLAPVAPLASPGRRSLAMLPLALALLLLPPLYWGLRDNYALLGGLLAWAPSSLESVTGLVLLWLAFRASVPGTPRPTPLLYVAMAAGVALFVAITLLTASEFPTVEGAGAWLRSVGQCLRMALPFALPSVALVALLVARALPERPALVGAAYGLGVGLMTDAGVRLFCWVTEASHVLAAHGGAIAMSTLGGAAVAVLLERAKGAARARR